MTDPTDGSANPQRRQHDAFDWVTLIVGVLTLVAVGIYTGIQAWQTTLIRSNNVVSQRASVYFEQLTGAIARDPDVGGWPFSSRSLIAATLEQAVSSSKIDVPRPAIDSATRGAFFIRNRWSTYHK
jgi:hypothetical protein